MYCSKCGAELADDKVNFCQHCGTKLVDSISAGMYEFEVLDDTEESIESGMRKFETKNSSYNGTSESIQSKIKETIETIEELLGLWEGCYDNFSRIEIDFYKAVKYKLQEGTTVLIIDKYDDWEEWFKIYKDLEKLFEEALYYLSLLKPNFFVVGNKRYIYKYWLEKYSNLASKHNNLVEIVENNSEYKILEDVD